ncbi:MAG: PAS domain S-box protein [Bacteroidia bacterium]|nr:PAS domain S-box protein [Bacteroidia bacterium]
MKPNPIHLLLIEDNPEFVQTLKKEYLSGDLDLQYRHAASLHEASQLIAREIPDVILLDLNLPDSNGFETLKRTRESWPDLPVVVLTASGVSGKKALELGAQDFLTKQELLRYDGALLHRALGYAIDRKQLEKEKLESEILLLEAMNNAPVSILVLRMRDRKVIFVNDRFCQTLGYEREIVLGSHSGGTDPFPPVALQKILMESLREGRETRNMALQFPTKEGKIADFILHVNQANVGGEPCIIAIANDISLRVRAETELEKERFFNERILETMGSILGVIDREGNLVRFNRAGEQISGYSAGELIGKKFWEVVVPPEMREAMQEEFPGLLLEKNLHTVEGPWIDKQGRTHIISWTFSNLPDESGQTRFVITSGVDVTEQRKLDVSLMQAFVDGEENERKRMAEELHDGIGPVISGSILNLESIDPACLDEQQHQKLETAKSLLKRAARETREISHNLTPSGLQDFGLVSALEDLCHQSQTEQGPEISFQTSGNPGRFSTQTELGLYRIAQELVANALHHARAREISVQLIRRDPLLVLMVEDDGIGFHFPPDQTEGLGLHNIRTRARALSGTVNIDSTPGKGTAITVEIPLI